MRASTVRGTGFVLNERLRLGDSAAFGAQVGQFGPLPRRAEDSHFRRHTAYAYGPPSITHRCQEIQHPLVLCSLPSRGVSPQNNGNDAVGHYDAFGVFGTAAP